ncbi:SMP-30/gluconolactonase/LRE family protein [Rhodoferax sediminis]|uniref:SMP-30/gluconolactonase/LRE family protein n=1 Tax=Rhodoferax sediminis TaxID=2509614 RepID=A0A515DGB2_9BURK|nr:SMP-30/gluconolactonase/LRE family protein [Rhodoferax sediminis]QDL39451.1 SMP-30/gluconolactonase/LRE family protein [Rhodoferax sediminis]
MTWQTVVTEPSQLGESPFWHPHEELLYWVDIPARRILRANVFMGTLERWAMPTEPGCIAPARSGGLVIALRDGMYRATTWGGELKLLLHFDHDPATTRFNDGKADPLGRFWAGTMYEPRDRCVAELFSLDCRNAQAGGPPVLERKAGGAVIANGLAWSPDARTVYWSDTTRHVIYAWDWDAASNAMTRRRVFQQLPGKPDGWKTGMPGYGGRPDGAAVDAEGNYYSAMFEGRRLLKFAPTGELLADIPVPVQCPTMPCFGGADLQTLYLTTACHGRPAAELSAMPQSGCVFSMRVEVPGLPVNFFVD